MKDTNSDIAQLEWIHKPERYIVSEDKVILETEPFTSLVNENQGAEAIELSLQPAESFSFTVRVDFDFKGQFDQCGIVLYNGKKRLASCCVKHHNDEVEEMECIVFHGKYGDKSSRDIGTAIHWMYYRVWYRSGIVRIQYSFNGKVYSDVRQFINEDTKNPIRIGIYACSPNESSFDCAFSQMSLTD